MANPQDPGRNQGYPYPRPLAPQGRPQESGYNDGVEAGRIHQQGRAIPNPNRGPPITYTPRGGQQQQRSMMSGRQLLPHSHQQSGAYSAQQTYQQQHQVPPQVGHFPQAYAGSLPRYGSGQHHQAQGFPSGSYQQRHHSHQNRSRQQLVPQQKQQPELRQVSHEERQHLQRLLLILHSWDNLTLEALKRNETLPRTRLQLHKEIALFMRNITTDKTGDQSILNKVMYCPSTVADLRLLSRDSIIGPGTSDKGKEKEEPISFDDFVKKAAETAKKNRKGKTATPDRGARIPPDDTADATGKGKGKARARDKKRGWQDEGERDILDDLDMN